MKFLHSLWLLLIFKFIAYSLPAQTAPPSTGPVFEDLGPVFDIPEADFPLDTTQMYRAVFDISYEQKTPKLPNPLIGSLVRYYNMHVRAGVPPENIQLAFVVHGHSTHHVLSDEAYQKKFGVKNPNTPYIKALQTQGVQMYICGQSAASRGYPRRDILPEVKMALSAMSVLTVLQGQGYAMIRF